MQAEPSLSQDKQIVQFVHQEKRARQKPDCGRDIADLTEINRAADRLEPEEHGKHQRRGRDLRKHERTHNGENPLQLPALRQDLQRP